MIILSEAKMPSYSEFIKHYCLRIEERFLCDFKVYPSNHPNSLNQQLHDIYRYLIQMKVDPIRFLDYVFVTTDEIPIPQRMFNYLKYKGLDDMKLQYTIYDSIDDAIKYVCSTVHAYPSLIDFFFKQRVNPFLVIFDTRVKYYIYKRKLPKQLVQYSSYFKQLCCAQYLIDDFMNLKLKLIKDWVPVLEELKRKEKVNAISV